MIEIGQTFYWSHKWFLPSELGCSVEIPVSEINTEKCKCRYCKDGTAVFSEIKSSHIFPIEIYNSKETLLNVVLIENIRNHISCMVEFRNDLHAVMVANRMYIFMIEELAKQLDGKISRIAANYLKGWNSRVKKYKRIS